jgi:membrane-associated phospholipid phosphatase
MTWIRRHALLTGATLALGGFLGLADGSIQHTWLGVDQATRGAVGLTHLPELDTPMRTLTLLGSRAGLISLTALAFVLLWGYRRRWALGLPVIMAGTGGLQLVAKWAVNRPRPNLADWGYPSGHVLSLVVFFGLVAYLLRTSRASRGWRLLGGGACAGIVLTVAFSRLYLDVHWLTDVIGGFALGLAYLLLTIWLVEALRRRRVNALSVPRADDSLPAREAPIPA